jgi:hypothetical protein
MAGCQPNPRASRQRDPRRYLPPAIVAVVVVSVEGSITAVIRIRDPFANSTSIQAGSRQPGPAGDPPQSAPLRSSLAAAASEAAAVASRTIGLGEFPASCSSTDKLAPASSEAPDQPRLLRQIPAPGAGTADQRRTADRADGRPYTRFQICLASAALSAVADSAFRGIHIQRATLAFWVGYAAAELVPVYLRMRARTDPRFDQDRR